MLQLTTTAAVCFYITNTASAQTEGALIKKSPDSSRTSSITILPYGILAGEFDGRPWKYPYNGLFLSRNLGETWTEIGLGERGVTDTAFLQTDHPSGMVLASTYYSVGSQTGLFKSEDQGQTFQKIGPNFSTSNVETSNQNIIIGGYNHGLWVSIDQGQSWAQKIGNGTGWTGPHIVNVTAKNNLVLASTTTKIYTSEDSGLTWNEISQLAGEQIHTFLISDEVILAGCQNNQGIFRSFDNGQTWERLSNWGEYPTGKMIKFKNDIYVQKIDTNTQQYNFYKSSNNGDSWEITSLDPGIRMKDIKLLHSYPAYFFISTEVDGVHRYSIPTNQPHQENFLQIPWAYENFSELTDKITAYFDHQYPLTGYVFHPEPPSHQADTISFYGLLENNTTMFYSSHNGTDFSLPFGEEVLAAASGLAHYYYCDWCGHSIKIDHPNGHQTVYMHLQKDGLISDDISNKIWVGQGSIIGKVGMTGKTSGPHLHFGVLKNGVYPDGLVDPFSWLDPYNQDPWSIYSWHDELGNHQGSQSKYLWLHDTEVQRSYIEMDNNEVVLGNKTVSFDIDNLSNNLFTTVVINYVKPYLPFDQYHLSYVEGTSLSITAEDHFGEGIVNGMKAATISIDLSSLNYENVFENSLKIYMWNKIKQKWEPLPTLYDHLQKTLTANTTHLSHFAVFGEKIYPNGPLSTLLIDAEKDENWCVEPPTITILSQDYSGLGIKNIYISKNGGLDWDIYEQPFVLKNDGVTELLFRAEDMTGNLEPTNSHIVKVDTKGSWKDQAAIKDAVFIFSD